MLIRIYTQMYTYMNALILRSVCIHPPQHWRVRVEGVFYLCVRMCALTCRA